MPGDEMPHRVHVTAPEYEGEGRRRTDVVPDQPPPAGGTAQVLAALPEMVRASGETAARAAAETTQHVVGGMGLRGITLANIGNTTAMAIIAMVFVWQLYRNADDNREARDLFRQEVQSVRDANDRRYDRLADRIDQMARSQADASVELRRLTDALYQTNRELRALPPKVDPQSRRPALPDRIPLAQHVPCEARP